MFFKQWEGSVVTNTKSVKMQCPHCGNESEHRACIDHKFGVGIIFMKTPLLSVKKYYLVCPICMNATQELSKEQVNALKQ